MEWFRGVFFLFSKAWCFCSAPARPFLMGDRQYRGQMQGQEAIFKHFTEKVTFQQVQHLVTCVDSQPQSDGSVIVSVLGQLKVRPRGKGKEAGQGLANVCGVWCGGREGGGGVCCP